MTGQERISRLYSTAPELEELYTAKVRRYTIIAHTLNVLNQFEKYFSDDFNEIDIETFRLLLLLHDVGKPIAYKNGNRHNQYTDTVGVILKYQKNLDISDKDFRLFKAMLNNDSLGLYIQGKISLDTVYDDIYQKSNEVEVDVQKFFYLLSVYYQCDLASYTEDAGGLKFLEHLFQYKDGHKEFNNDRKLLKFSREYQEKYDYLLNKISGKKQRMTVNNPSNIKHIKGNIFSSKCQTLVNTVNCVGVMGKGIALVHKLRYPEMYLEYREHCKNKLINIGSLWLYKKQKNAPWILSFPTKFHWKYPSKIEWIEQGLQKFVDTYGKKGITSVAFPLLGTHNGGLNTDEVRKLMDKYLVQCNIEIEIYDYDPNANDDLFAKFKTKWLSLDEKTIKDKTGIQPQYARKISEIIQNGEINSMIALANYDGIGEKTLEKAFNYVLNNK